MTEQQPAHDSIPNGFDGKYVSIELESDDYLTELLSTSGVLKTLLEHNDEDFLPYPAKEIHLESWYDDTCSMQRIEGEVNIRPTSIESNETIVWPTTFLEEIDSAIQHYGYDTSRIKHDDRAIYITLDTMTTVRISLAASATQIGVDIDLEPTRDIEKATHISLQNPYAEHPMTDLERLRHVTTMLGVVIDTLRECYGNSAKRYVRYTIKQHKPSKELAIVDIDATMKGNPHPSEYSGVDDREHTSLDSIGGATQAKERLAELASIVNDPEAAAAFDIQPTHILLHGPPGTGKTTLINAFASEINATTWTISSSDLIEKWVGSSGRNLAETFKNAKAISGNLVLFLAAFGALAHRQGSGGGERTDIRTLLNTELESLTKNYTNIIVAAATNVDLDELEPSLIRSGRMEPIAVPLPTEQERFDFFGVILYESIRKKVHENELVFDENGEYMSADGFSLYDVSIDLRDLAARTDGMTGADFKQILLRARKRKFSHYRTTGELQLISHNDILHEIMHFGR